MIFLYLRAYHIAEWSAESAPDFDHFMINPRQFCYGYKWTRVMLVCRYWYSVAKAFPQLWTVISLDHFGRKERLLKSHLLRSGTLPLTVEIPVDAHVDDRFINKVLDNLYRLQRLRIDGELTSVLETRIVESDAPLLETFAMYTDVDDFDDTVDEIDESEPLTLPVLFHNTHPRLISLSFQTYRRYDNNDFTTLRHLHVSKQAFVLSEDFYALLALLGRIPTLEVFMISKTRSTRIMEEAVDALNTENYRIGLPQLQTIILSEVPLSFAGLVLRSLSLAQGRNLAVMFRAKELYIERPSLEDRWEVGIPGLQLLGAEWGEITREAHTMSINAYAQGWWNLIAISERRELCLQKLYAKPHDVPRALRGLVSCVRDIWLNVLDSKDMHQRFDLTLPVWFLKNAIHAKRVFLEINIHGDGPLSVLEAFFSDPDNSLVHLMECHAVIHHTGPVVANQTERLFRAVATSMSAIAFHVYLSIPWDDKTADPIAVWEDMLRTSELGSSVHVHFHLAKDFPRASLSKCCRPPSGPEWGHGVTGATVE